MNKRKFWFQFFFRSFFLWGILLILIAQCLVWLVSDYTKHMQWKTFLYWKQKMILPLTFCPGLPGVNQLQSNNTTQGKSVTSDCLKNLHFGIGNWRAYFWVKYLRCISSLMEDCCKNCIFKMLKKWINRAATDLRVCEVLPWFCMLL